jgi:hypothetical protein
MTTDLTCSGKLQSAGISKSASEDICNRYRLNPNATAKDILCAIKFGNKACSNKEEQSN